MNMPKNGAKKIFFFLHVFLFSFSLLDFHILLQLYVYKAK